MRTEIGTVGAQSWTAERSGRRTALLFSLISLLGTVRGVDAQVFATLHDFGGAPTDGSGPVARSGLIVDSAGNLYGTTFGGGASDDGTVFKRDVSGALILLHSFSAINDISTLVETGLVMDSEGNLYGTTGLGGSSTACTGPGQLPGGCGTVFKLDTSGTFTVLHSFSVSDGVEPLAGLIMDSAGNLYGTTALGGSDTVDCPGGGGSSGVQPGCGTVFKLDSSGNLIVLHSFRPSEGIAPLAALVMDSAGNLYGTTCFSGPSGGGTVFKLDTSGTLTVLHSFPGNSCFIQAQPGLILDSAGHLFGATVNGGTSTACGGGCGTIFRLDTSGNNFTVLHSFSVSDGGLPSGSLTMDSAGNLYGTTNVGGSSTACPGIVNIFPPGCGTVFRFDRSGNFSVIHNFAASDGSSPNGGLVKDSAGNLYGTTTFGGSAGKGTVYLLASSPQNATQVIVNQVNGLCAQGLLNSGQCNSLTRELDQAISLLNKGKTAGAVQNLQDFVSEVQDLQNSGVLTASQAESLVSEAKSVIGNVSS